VIVKSSNDQLSDFKAHSGLYNGDGTELFSPIMGIVADGLKSGEYANAGMLDEENEKLCRSRVTDCVWWIQGVEGDASASDSKAAKFISEFTPRTRTRWATEMDNEAKEKEKELRMDSMRTLLCMSLVRLGVL
jgi:hypothetical protein